MSKQEKKDKKRMSREEITELYKDVHSAMKKLKEKKGAEGISAQAAMTDDITSRLEASESAIFKPMNVGSGDRGKKAALALVVAFSCLKIGISAMENLGFAGVESAQAVVQSQPRKADFAGAQQGMFTKEEVTILTSLDKRRAELEQRNRALDERGQDLDRKEKEFAIRLNQLRELTDKLKLSREGQDKKRNVQIDQLANVYGSMEPKEAAKLIEQLDVTIALDLLKRMPEKRIAQILALMSSDRALTITRMLSGS